MLRATIVVLVACLMGAGDDKPDAKWVDSRVQTKVRERMASLVGQPLPQPSTGLKWLGEDKPALGAGKVIVIQSVGASGGKSLLEKIRKALPEDVLLVGLHHSKKPERVEKDFAQKRPCPVAIDTDGVWFAALDLPETPTNIVVDTSGKIRFVCLRTESLKQAVVAAAEQPEMPGEAGASTPSAVPPPPVANKAFPMPAGSVQYAMDRRGQKMPEFAVEEWITKRPEPPSEKLLVLDFWATWCGPCVASIPHMNQLAGKFGDIALFVGVSDEQSDAFAKGLTKIKKTPKDFSYSLALAPSRAMSNYFAIQGIPHCVIVSSDGIVRWQGMPSQLSEDIFQQYADAQRTLNAANAPSGGKNPPNGPRKY
jgi:thiol-disulfide isomerase/thioredoxin